MYKHTYIALQPILSPRPPISVNFVLSIPVYISSSFLTLLFLFKSNWKLPIRIYSINHLISLIFARRRTSNVRINISNLLMLSSFLRFFFISLIFELSLDGILDEDEIEWKDMIFDSFDTCGEGGDVLHEVNKIY